MNATLKAICALLKRDEPELQQAAVKVLGAVHTREPGVHKSLGELLIETKSPGVFAAVLDAMEGNPHEQTLRYLLRVLETENAQQERVLSAIARIGGKAVGDLRRHFDRSDPATRLKIVTLLPRIRTPQAHAFLIDCCFSADSDIVREAVHGIREEMHRYDAREKGDLQARLTAALDDRRLKAGESAASAVIIALGIVGDIRSKNKLLAFVAETQPKQIRRHALMSLARLEYAGDKHQAVVKELLPLLDDPDYEGLVRHAVQVLIRIRPGRGDNAKLQSLLQNPHVGVQAYAVQALGQLDSVTNAEKVIAFLNSPESSLRDAAAQALRRMPSAVTVILRHIDEEKNRARLFEMVRILEAHSNRISPDKARGMVKRMLELYDAGDEQYQIYRSALRHLRGDVLQAEVLKLARAMRAKEKFDKVRDYLKLLDHTELLDAETRFMLAVAKLKTSKKYHSRSFRLTDYCLEHIALLLRDDPKGFKRKLLAEKALDAGDLLYVGFHFSEKLNEERRFGADLLRHVATKFPKSKDAKIAKQKLKVEGH